MNGIYSNVQVLKKLAIVDYYTSFYGALNDKS